MYETQINKKILEVEAAHRVVSLPVFFFSWMTDHEIYSAFDFENNWSETLEILETGCFPVAKKCFN